MKRQVVLATETTGLSIMDGHRIIEISCVELIDRELTGNDFHRYIYPQRDIDKEAEAIHGLSFDLLKFQPVFSQIQRDFVNYIYGAELIIHRADFDIEFLDCEFSLTDFLGIDTLPMRVWCPIIDTYKMAREKYPGQRNALRALSERLGLKKKDVTSDKPASFPDVELLARVYLAMTDTPRLANKNFEGDIT